MFRFLTSLLLAAPLLGACTTPESTGPGQPAAGLLPELDGDCVEYLAELRGATGDSIYWEHEASIPAGFERPVKVYVPPPAAYPPNALRNLREGSVLLGGIVEPDGSTSHAKVLRGSLRGMFDEVAFEAFQQWGYNPALLDGQPVRSYSCQQISFSIN